MKLKDKIERLIKGYSKEDLYDVDIRLAEVIFPIVRAFLHSNRNGYPIGLTKKEWERILRKIVWTFKIISRSSERIGETEFDKKIDEGLHLFAEYFHCLWD